MRYSDIKLVEKRKHKTGPAGQAKAKGTMPKAKPGRTEHPLQGKLVGESTIFEDARIQHAEDIIFWEGSKGAVRAIESLKSIETGKHGDVTIKWDGSPAVIFGRDENGAFVFTDKSGFTAKGYDGKARSADDLETMLGNRPGANNPDPKKQQGYRLLINNMKAAWTAFELATPKDYKGFFKGDMLYFDTPKIEDGRYHFTPNIVTYDVKADSPIGQRITQSTVGIVIHREVDAAGTEGPLQSGDIFQGNAVLVLPPVVTQEPPQINDEHIKELQAIVSKSAGPIDALLSNQTLTDLKLKKLPDLFYAYLNSKVDTGLTELGSDFLPFVNNKKAVSEVGKRKVADYCQQNKAGYDAMWRVVSGIMRVKDDIINQLEQQEADIKASIGPKGPAASDTHGAGGEGYVMAHPGGDIKLVPRHTFSKANRSVQR
jgi:hypothetical protein|tara:strand:- start:5569 stop:6855 length:1287 start_codon:yes stop_codon:yes gene_type:complete